MKKLQIVPAQKMEEMRKMLNTYLTELSEFDPDVEFDERGVPIYKWFELYWKDKDRFPFYLIIDKSVAGLALIRELNDLHYDFAEFYVAPEYRKDGNAVWFANAVVDLFEGKFSFSTRFTNPRAIKFWTKFSNQFENSSCTDDPIWRNWTIQKNTKN